MHEFLHFIGLCPDSMSHFDLMDVFTNIMVGVEDFVSSILCRIKYLKLWKIRMK